MLEAHKGYKHTRLEELSTRNISEIDAEYDLRSFKVLNVDEQEIGTVTELLFDVQSKKIRYLVIQLNENSGGSSRKILAPIGTVEPDGQEDVIIIPALNSHLINVLPDYEPGQVNPGVENMVRLAYAGEDLLAEGGGLTGHAISDDDDDFYNHLHFDLNKLFGKKKKPVEYIQTLCGVFDDSLEAENTITDLIKEGFSQNVIELSSSKQADSDAGIDESINGGGSVICVKIQNTDEAVRASEIMNINGSVSVYETND